MAGPTTGESNIRQRLEGILGKLYSAEVRLDEGSVCLTGPLPSAGAEAVKSPTTVEELLQHVEASADRVFFKTCNIVDRI